MSAKPTILPEFASDPTAEITTPPGAQIDSGWTGGQDPPHAYFNWLHYHTFLWCQWLYDGDVSFDSIITAEGDVQHASVEHAISPLAANVTAGTVSSTEATHGAGFTVSLDITYALKVGDKINSARIRLYSAGAAWAAPKLYKRDITTRTATDISGTVVGSGAGDQWWTMTPASPVTVESGYHYFIEVVSGINGGSMYGAGVFVSR